MKGVDVTMPHVFLSGRSRRVRMLTPERDWNR